MTSFYEPVPCLIRGVLYPSITAAAKALGVHRATVYEALERGTIDKVGLKKGRNVCIPIEVDGVSYRSVTAAAVALGVNRSTLSRTIYALGRRSVTLAELNNRYSRAGMRSNENRSKRISLYDKVNVEEQRQGNLCQSQVN